MSKLIDKFRKAAQSSSEPMGFRTARTAARSPGLLLIASTGLEIKNTPDIIGASAVLMRVEGPVPGPKSIQKIAAALPDIPLGLYLEDVSDAEELEETGLDFLVFPVSSRISVPPKEKKMGRIIQVESSLDDNLLRSVNSLPVDAVLVEDTFEGGSMIWHELLIFQYLSNIIGKPLIANIPANISEAELKALWEAGADGVMVDVSAMKDGEFKGLVEAISKLPPRTARRRGRMEVTLPRAGAESQTPPPDEEEEEDE